MSDELRERLRTIGLKARRFIWKAAEYTLKAIEAYREMPGECARCHRAFPNKTLHHIQDIPTYAGRWLRFCDDCHTEMREEYESELRYLYDFQKVVVHNKRAIDEGLVGTLTYAEWQVTLDYFGRMCAYCRVAPYEALEHFIPIDLHGGTTADNCVPACKSCNSRKGASHPDVLEQEWPVIASIRAYLLTRRPQLPSARPSDQATIMVPVSVSPLPSPRLSGAGTWTLAEHGMPLA